MPANEVWKDHWANVVVGTVVVTVLILFRVFGADVPPMDPVPSSGGKHWTDYVGLLANVVMAGAAILAFTLWRKQVRGESRHSLAIETMTLVVESRVLIAQIFHVLRWMQMTGAKADRSLGEDDFKSLDDNGTLFHALSIRVRAQWPNWIPLLEFMRLMHEFRTFSHDLKDASLSRAEVTWSGGAFGIDWNAVAAKDTSTLDEAVETHARRVREWLSPELGPDSQSEETVDPHKGKHLVTETKYSISVSRTSRVHTFDLTLGPSGRSSVEAPLPSTKDDAVGTMTVRVGRVEGHGEVDEGPKDS